MKISGSNSYKSLAIISVAFIAFAFYCYQPFALWFQNDDFTHILLSKQGKLFQHNSFRPVCDLSVMLDYYLWGTNAWGYHLTNLVLHTLCSSLVFLLTSRLFKLILLYTSIPLAFICSVFFFVYSFHCEAVFWILGRSAILGAIFSFLFLLIFLQKEQTAWSVIGYSISFMLALLSYESSWSLLLIAPLLIKLSKEIKFKTYKKHLYVLLLLFVLYLASRWMRTGEIAGEYEAGNLLHPHFIKLISNFATLVFRGFMPAYKEAVIILYIAFLIILAFVVNVFYRCDKRLARYICFMFLVSLLPYLSLGIAANTTEGERFLYLPSFFICLLFCFAMAIAPLKKYAAVFCMIVFIAHSIQLYINARNYRLAGNIAKLTLTELAKCKEYQEIQIESLPQEQLGAFIFREGLINPVALLYPQLKTTMIKVLSVRNEMEPLHNTYHVKYERSQADSGTAKFIFTDTALIIYK